MVPYAAAIVDRKKEVAQVTASLRSDRLVTMYGAPGVGKTRIAIEVLARLRASGQGSAFVDLAATDDEQEVPLLLAGALGVALRAGRPIDTVTHYLRDRPMTIVLDNCEHILAGAARAGLDILGHTSQVRIVATSRTVLGVSGESTLPIRPLRVPSEVTSGTAPAVQMFYEVAQRSRPGWVPDAAEELLAAEICELLEGVPLAIELAALQTRSFGLADIRQNAAVPLDLAGPGARDTFPRARTLRASIESSYTLCSPRERRAWQQLSVLRGTFSLDAARDLLSAGLTGASEEDVRATVRALVEKSILSPSIEFESASRFRFLDMVRRFGLEQLEADGLAEQARDAHAEYFARQFGDLELRATEPGAGDRFRAAFLDIANFRSALASCVGTRSRQHLLEDLIVRAIPHVLWRMGAHAEARDWCARALQSDDLAGPLRARIAVLGAIQNMRVGDMAAAHELLLSVRDHPSREVQVDYTLAEGVESLLLGRPQDTADSMRALIAGSTGPLTTSQIMRRRQALTHSLMAQGQIGQAADVCRQMVDELPDDEVIYSTYALRMLGLAEWGLGEVEAARARTARLLDLLRDVPALPDVADSLRLTALLLAGAGDSGATATLLGAVSALDLRREDSLLLTIVGSAAETDLLALEVLRTTHAVAWRRGARMSVAVALETARDALAGRPSATGVGTQLTPRERQVAGLVAKGWANKRIAAALTVSVRTVEVHVERIRVKLDAPSRVDIANRLNADVGEAD